MHSSLATLATPPQGPDASLVDLSVTVDRSGPWPTLLVGSGTGPRIALNSRRSPVVDAERHVTAVLRGAEPATLVLIGLGLGYTLDALERLCPATRVIGFEPLPASIPHLLARRDWSAWLDTGRLHLVAGPDYANGREAWAAIAPATLPPVIVNPALAHAHGDLVAAARGAVARAQYGSPLDPRRVAVRQSMLHQHVLTALEHAAATASGAVVEIGAYVGGATIAMSRGIRDSGRATPLFTIEPGGSHLTHPDLPSDDIFGDLVANLRARSLERFVTLLRGVSSDSGIVETVRSGLAERNLAIGLLCIDADGHVQRDFDLYLPMCGNGCLIAVDDYSGPPENIKADLTQTAVDDLVKSGRARSLGVFGWGTWFGVYNAAPADARVTARV